MTMKIFAEILILSLIGFSGVCQGDDEDDEDEKDYEVDEALIVNPICEDFPSECAYEDYNETILVKLNEKLKDPLGRCMLFHCYEEKTGMRILSLKSCSNEDHVTPQTVKFPFPKCCGFPVKKPKKPKKP
ncbi:UNVERIFIED_CONTAM: hypothetical protein RMT77_000679 [Armadillidium vulgare]